MHLATECVERGIVSEPIAEDGQAFESAVSRLPYPVFVVDSQSRLRAMNASAKHLWITERMHESQIERSPSHPISRLVINIRSGAIDEDETTVLQLAGGVRYEVIHSIRSPKGEGRWHMLMLRPFPTPLTVDRKGLRKRWSLTPRESDVAALCIAGRTSAEICEALCISRETLKTHMARLLGKADCQNRSQLIAKYLFNE